MIGYVVRRILTFIPALLIVAVLTAVMIDLIPGDPVALLMGDEAPGEAINMRRREMGLDRPMHVRLLEWLANAARGDFGKSYFLGKSVSATIAERLGVTLWLAVLGIALASVVGIILGVVASVRQGRLIDWLVQTSSLVWLSIPQFWFALLLIFFFAVNLRWLPIGGYVSPLKGFFAFGTHMVMPVVCLALGYIGIIARFTRTSMLEVLREDYVATARAKGLAERVVLFRHALRNAFVSILTMIGIGFGDMLGGAVVIELVFNMPGLGRMILDAVKRRDYPVIQGGIFAMTAAYLLVNLIVDLLYMAINKRISLK